MIRTTVRSPAGRADGGRFTAHSRSEAVIDLAPTRLTLESGRAEIEAAARHIDPHIRVMAAYHPNAELERTALLHDPDGRVRQAAENARRYGKADLAMAFDLAARLSASTH